MRASCYCPTNNDLPVLGITVVSLDNSSKTIFGTQAVTFCQEREIIG